MYLSIGRPRIHDSGINSDIYYALERQHLVRDYIKDEYNYDLPNDIWIIAELNLEQLYFFYFNDENADNIENPPVYFFIVTNLNEGEKASEDNIHLSDNSLSDYVDSYAKPTMLRNGYAIED